MAGLNKFYNQKDETWYLYWANKNEYVIYEVKYGELSGGEKIRVADDYEMSETVQTSDFVILQFENEKAELHFSNKEQFIFKVVDESISNQAIFYLMELE